MDNTGTLSPEELTPEQIQDLLESKEKYEKGTKEAQLLSWENKILKNPEEYIKLYDSDKRISKEIAERNSFDSPEAMLEHIKTIGSNAPDVDTVAQKVVELQEKQKVENAVSSFLEDKWVDAETDFWKDVIKEYQSLVWKRSIDFKTAQKYLKMAYKEALDTSEFVKDYEKQALEKKAAWIGGGTKWWKPQHKPYDRYKYVTIKDMYGLED